MKLLHFFTKNREKEDWFINDKSFDRLYPEHIRAITRPQWTPLRVAKKAAAFLTAANPNCRILDIGSGVGKFCLIAGHYHPFAQFTGVEQRASLIEIAEEAKKQTGIVNASFVHANITDVSFSKYDHLYFFNSFYENLAIADKIDEDLDFTEELYKLYNEYLYAQLETMPSGTRLCIYFGTDTPIPGSYKLVKSMVDGRLRCFIRR